jgi:hypothetical protein
MNHVIDTNVLYRLTGVEQAQNDEHITEQRLASIKALPALCVSSVSVIEAIVRYRNEPERLHACLKPLAMGELHLCEIGFAPAQDFVNELSSKDTLEEWEPIIAKVFEFKIKLERDTIFFFLFTVSLVLIEFLLDQAKPILSDEQYELLNLESLKIGLLLESEKSLLEVALRKGYACSKYGSEIDEVVRDSFNTILLTKIRYWIRHKIAIEKGCAWQVVTPEQIESVPLCEKTTDRKQLSSLLRNEKRRVKTALSRIASQFKGDARFAEIPFSYIFEKLTGMLTSDATIHKNDSMDLLIVYIVSSPDNLVVTFDSGIQRFVKRNHRASYDLMASKDLIRPKVFTSP